MCRRSRRRYRPGKSAARTAALSEASLTSPAPSLPSTRRALAGEWRGRAERRVRAWDGRPRRRGGAARRPRLPGRRQPGGHAPAPATGLPAGVPRRLGGGAGRPAGPGCLFARPRLPESPTAGPSSPLPAACAGSGSGLVRPRGPAAWSPAAGPLGSPAGPVANWRRFSCLPIVSPGAPPRRRAPDHLLVSVRRARSLTLISVRPGRSKSWRLTYGPHDRVRAAPEIKHRRSLSRRDARHLHPRAQVVP